VVALIITNIASWINGDPTDSSSSVFRLPTCPVAPEDHAELATQGRLTGLQQTRTTETIPEPYAHICSDNRYSIQKTSCLSPASGGIFVETRQGGDNSRIGQSLFLSSGPAGVFVTSSSSRDCGLKSTPYRDAKTQSSTFSI